MQEMGALEVARRCLGMWAPNEPKLKRQCTGWDGQKS